MEEYRQFIYLRMRVQAALFWPLAFTTMTILGNSFASVSMAPLGSRIRVLSA
ncbi:uncharacterized protein BDW43DRAFT_295361 [Aspergillus alliaceus]|uniref:uncharacterized protein n=1 Tax=Petromyces alliaceus TaxID=209559 RepID=UPI0012A72A94|nr:uncharacterized protein BDW43DRAFT_295361 [Aspergillus alliaceus]KAB8226933.1 hypothetical protein BDW43DRAFT_295361 [Aspergillus alliaceus]